MLMGLAESSFETNAFEANAKFISRLSMQYANYFSWTIQNLFLSKSMLNTSSKSKACNKTFIICRTFQHFKVSVKIQKLLLIVIYMYIRRE